MALVTLEQVNSALRLDLQGTAPGYADDERTPDIELKIDQAQAIVLDFIQPKPDPAWTEGTAPGQVTAAIIMAIRCLLDDTDESMAMLSGLSGTTGADPKNPIVGLLFRLRKPSLA